MNGKGWHGGWNDAHYSQWQDSATETDYEHGNNGDGNKRIHSGECLIYGVGDSAWEKVLSLKWYTISGKHVMILRVQLNQKCSEKTSL